MGLGNEATASVDDADGLIQAFEPPQPLLEPAMVRFLEVTHLRIYQSFGVPKKLYYGEQYIEIR